MNPTWLAVRLLGWGLLGGALIGACGGLHALERATTGLGVAYVSGGVDRAERAELLQDKGRYSFWLTTAARRSGAYLADVHVRVLDRRTRQPVMEGTMDGPWLFMDLPAGHYEIQASYRETPDGTPQHQRRTLRLGPREHRRIVVYFDTPDLVGSDQDDAKR
jgi:hypothetical protein